MHLVFVVWEDIIGNGSWGALEDAPSLSPVVCLSTGFLVSKTKRKIVITQTLGEHKGVSGLLAIPTGAILSQGRVKLPLGAAKRLQKLCPTGGKLC